ncbi:hypothetical protein [Luteolibacter marinus]|uniref:hypothetical protein n=1 Tax=Luteolibacter marinus TaxID=2776705 RepID=UPI0018685672|nr:hypothetical protein [Luteolibacter marinus]
MKAAFAVLLLVAGLSSCQTAGPTSRPVSQRPAGVRPYPMVTCAVCEDLLDGRGPEVTEVRGRQELIFCSPACQQRFQASPSRYLAALPRAN